MREILPSVGIDIGTSTTQVIFSKLEIDNTSGFGAIPKIEIVSKEIIYESPVYTTPLRNEWEIDAEQVKKILFHEYEQAGIKPEELATGAVIITGESVKKKNAGCTAKQLSEIAGDFVVVTAGPDLESVLAGCGSGAAKLSEICGGLVANLDIGGGTTNICIFENGKVIDTACLDIGGRLIRIEDETIQYMSESIVKISTDIKSSLVVGAQIDKTDLKPLLQRMIQLLEEEMGFRQKTDLLSAVYTNHGLKKNYKLSHIVLSGGVAACVQALNNSADGKIEDEFLYDDIGVLLAEELKNSFCHTVSVCNRFSSASVFCDNLIFLVNISNLYGAVAIVLNCFNLCNYTRSSLQNCYRNQNSVFVIEDLSHSNFCSQNSFLHYKYLL